MARVQLQESDIVAAMWLHLRPGRVLAILLLAMLALVVCLTAFSFWTYYRHDIDPGDPSPWDAMPGYGVVLALLVVLILSVRWRARRAFRQSKLLRDPADIEWDGSRLTFRSDAARSAIPWGDYVKWKENDRLYLIYMSDQQYHVIPKRIFGTPEVERSFRQHLGKIGANHRA